MEKKSLVRYKNTWQANRDQSCETIAVEIFGKLEQKIKKY